MAGEEMQDEEEWAELNPAGVTLLGGGGVSVVQRNRDFVLAGQSSSYSGLGLLGICWV